MDRKEIIKKMLAVLPQWFEEQGRSLPWREDKDPYHVWVSEIMLQQTRIETVIPYYTRFVQEFPDIRALAEAEPEHAQKLWEGLGYYSRVRNLQKAALQIMTNHSGRFPEDYEKIRSLCGIGDYTAGAIASICFGIPVPAVDGNVLRVLSRITEDSRPVTDDKTKKEVRKELEELYPKENAGSCTQAIMELGETLCLPNGTPCCSRCPCRDFCCSSGGKWKAYPVREEKKSRKKESLTVFILRAGDRIALRKRPGKGLLAGLWELPNCPDHLDEIEAVRQAEKWGCRPAELTQERIRNHIFTHIEWEMKCFTVSCREMPSGFVWADQQQLSHTFSLPTAFRKLLNQSVK